ncbi:Trehalose-6-P synthase/phosphatase complex synthase subunit [Perkinsus chesapeaki]|uniref:Trehalose-6-P synthase/phosphatase complex synthase subunit n=1 Tax=Perkinsus chesapeaki TaxID=330153 RepID=A0A7J6LBQ9_PERCH|nr:Trehalose-6-P synthase/phosphatase complex synthase subunit [Perkinsus chesapeaki]
MRETTSRSGKMHHQRATWPEEQSLCAGDTSYEYGLPRAQGYRRMSRTNRGGELPLMLPRSDGTDAKELIKYAIKLFREDALSKSQAMLVQDFCRDPGRAAECAIVNGTLDEQDDEDRKLHMQMWVHNLEKAERASASGNWLSSKDPHQPPLGQLNHINLANSMTLSGQSTRAPSPYIPSPVASSPANSTIHNYMAAGALQQQTLNWQQHSAACPGGLLLYRNVPGVASLGGIYAHHHHQIYQVGSCASPGPSSPQFSPYGAVGQHMEGSIGVSLASPNAASPSLYGKQQQGAPELRRPQPSRLQQQQQRLDPEDVPLELMPTGTPPLPISRSPSPTLPSPAAEDASHRTSHTGGRCAVEMGFLASSPPFASSSPPSLPSAPAVPSPIHRGLLDR